MSMDADRKDVIVHLNEVKFDLNMDGSDHTSNISQDLGVEE